MSKRRRRHSAEQLVKKLRDAQAIVLDNLVAQVLVQEVPEPASLALVGAWPVWPGVLAVA